MNKDREKLLELMRRDLVEDLTKNDGENLREMIRYAKKSKSKKVRRTWKQSALTQR